MKVLILYGISANGVRRHVVNSPKVIAWLQRSFAAIFAALGVKLAMTDQLMQLNRSIQM